MLEIIKTAQTVNEQEKSRYWTSAANQIFDIPFCRARYAASNVTAASRDAIQAQIRNLVVTKNPNEAKKAARYATAVAEGGIGAISWALSPTAILLMTVCRKTYRNRR